MELVAATPLSEEDVAVGSKIALSAWAETDVSVLTTIIRSNKQFYR